MMYFMLALTLLVVGMVTAQSEKLPVTKVSKIPILYVYTVVSANCKNGLPPYIKISLQQALISQPDCDVIMASNYAECAKIEAIVDSIPGVKKIDVTTIASARTIEFGNTSKTVWDYGGELWTTSAQRFFSMEDIMLKYGYTEIIHVEADNLLYGKLTSILSTLRNGYPGLAATPLNDNKSFITASVLWISSFAALKKFNDFLLALGRNANKELDEYLIWLRPYGCCKKWGINPDKNGNGIKPFAVNEMSMLGYYHFLYPKDFYLFPVVPKYSYFTNRHVCNMSAFGPEGHLVGPPTGVGIWDPNSWGQYLGGTSLRRGRDRGFTDSSHIAGQAMRTTGCRPKMMCSNETIVFPAFSLAAAGINSTATTSTSSSSSSLSTTAGSSGSSSIQRYCYTAPFVRCAEVPWTPLWNLHVHSKHTQDYLSQPCTCNM